MNFLRAPTKYFVEMIFITLSAQKSILDIPGGQVVTEEGKTFLNNKCFIYSLAFDHGNFRAKILYFIQMCMLVLEFLEGADMPKKVYCQKWWILRGERSLCAFLFVEKVLEIDEASFKGALRKLQMDFNVIKNKMYSIRKT